MSYTSLNSWKQATAQNVIQRLPLQTFDSALVLAEQYLANVGGWEPVEPTLPTGAGEPADGATPEAAAVAAVTGQFERIYLTDLTATVQLRLRYNTNQPAGQNDTSVLAAIEADFREFLQQRLADSNIEFVSLDSYTGPVEEGGQTTTPIRVSINAEVSNGAPFMDLRAVALDAARRRFNLDSTWNVAALYFEPGTPSICIIRKYESSTYASLDPASTVQYILSVDPVSLSVQSGIQTTLS